MHCNKTEIIIVIIIVMHSCIMLTCNLIYIAILKWPGEFFLFWLEGLKLFLERVQQKSEITQTCCCFSLYFYDYDQKENALK